MKKFISVILAIMMVVSVMPFVLFAAEEEGYKEPANKPHVCHPTKLDKDGNEVLDLTDLDMKALYEAGAYTITFKDGKADENKPEYLVDGKNNTATRLTAGSTEITVETAGKTLIDFATLKIVVNGKGTVNGGSDYADKVTVDTKHNLKLNVVVYGLDKDGKDVVVFTSDKDIDTTNLTEVVLDVYEPGYKVVLTTVGAAEAGKGARRIWEIDATTVKGEETYVHTYANTITKYPSIGVEGEYTQKCTLCGYDNPEKQVIPALTLETIKGGKLTADDVEFKEVLAVLDKDGKPVLDDDGNALSYSKPTQADPAALFDGKTNSGGLWSGNGSYWTADPGAYLEINFKEAKVLSYVNITVTFNGWPGVGFEFYNDGKLVAIKAGNWKGEGDPAKDTADDRWTNTWENKTLDFTEYIDIAGKEVDQIIIRINHHTSANYRKISELDIGVHEHTYDDSLIESANGVKTEGKTCEYTFADASKVVCRECGAAAVGDKDGKVVMTIHDYPETVVDGKVVFDQSKAKVTEATCGKDGKIEYTCSHGYVDETKPVYARYTKVVDGKEVPVYGKNNQQLYLGKDGKGYDGTEIKDWSTIVVKEYSKTTCGDKLVIDVPATGEHKNAVSTVRVGKYPNCGATGTAYVICTDCKQRVDIKTVDDLLGMKLAADIVDINGVVVLKKGATITYKEDKDPKKTVDDIATIENMLLVKAGGILTIDIAYTEENTGKAFTVRYTLQNNDKDVLAVTSAVALPSGYHKMGYKTAVASTYTSHGVEGAYCTTCGTEFHNVTREAELLVPNAKLRTLGFSLRTAEFEGLRGTFTLNNDVIKGMQANGYNVRIWVVVTNEAGVSKEVQVYGAGSNAWVALDGKFSVVVKGGTADEVYTFSYKIVVDDSEGTAENVVELGKSSVAEVKAAQ